MYPMKPYTISTVSEIPTCMYKMNSYHTDLGLTDTMSVSNSSPTQRLIERQDAIIKNLESLKLELDELAVKIPSSQVMDTADGARSSKAKSGTIASNMPPCRFNKPSPMPKDLVISCNPNCQPRAAVSLINRLNSKYQILCSEFEHSSAVGPSRSLDLSSTGFSGFKIGASRAQSKLVITWVWSLECESVQLMVSPIRQTKIVGEANVCRYLQRLLGEFNLEPVTATLADIWLDSASILSSCAAASSEKAVIVGRLAKALSKGQNGLVGEDLGLADLVLVSVLTSAPDLAEKCKNSPTFKSWMNNVQKLFVC